MHTDPGTHILSFSLKRSEFSTIKKVLNEDSVTQQNWESREKLTAVRRAIFNK